MKDKLILDTLEKIKKEHIKPKPRWEFLLKSYMFWGAFALSVVLGSMAVAVIIFKSQASDWDLYRLSGHSLFSFMLKTMPLIWTLTLALLLLISFYNIRHTKKGYKYNFGLLIIFNIILSFSLGAGMHALGYGRNIEDQLTKKIPAYRDYSYGPMYKMWSCSDCGLIAGRIEQILTPQKFIVIDFNDKEWIILSDDMTIRRNIKIVNGELLKLIGKKLSDTEFMAKELRPWLAPHHNRRHPKPTRMMQFER